MTATISTSNSPMFTLGQVLDATRAVVAEKGEDFVYNADQRCVYAQGGAPSCLIGHVVDKLDPEAFRVLADSEERSGGRQADELTRARYLPANFWDADTAWAMTRAQIAQDRGLTWGEALYEAESEF